MNTDKNYQFNYNRLLNFLSQVESGYGFAIADDQRTIVQINQSLISDLKQKGKTVSPLFIRPDSDTPMLYQMELAAKDADAIIVGNLYDLVQNTPQGLDNLQVLNFGRETMRHLNVPILFWTDKSGLHLLTNHAPDFFSQRNFTTLHFEGKVESPLPQAFEKTEWKDYVSTEQFRQTEAKIATLRRRLESAKAAGYHPNRIANDIALPLANEYALLSMTAEAEKLLADYQPNFDETNYRQLQLRANIYHQLHQTQLAIDTMEKANEWLMDKETGIVPMQWFTNVVDISDWLREIGNLEKALSTLLNAEQKLTEQKEIFSKTDADWNIPLIKARVGDINLKLGNREEAKKYYKERLFLSQQLAKAKPANQSLQRNLSVAYEKVGNIHFQSFNMQEAKEMYEKVLSIRKQLSKDHPGNESYKRDLAVSYNKVGNVYEKLGDLRLAKTNYEDGLRLRQDLLKINPLSEQLQRDLSVSFERIGNISELSGDLQHAKEMYEALKEIATHLCMANPQNEELQRDLAVSFENLGDIEKSKKNPKKAKKLYGAAKEILQTLSAKNPINQQLKDDVEKINNSLASLRIKP